MNIKVLLSFKNYVVIKDNITNYIWLYSYNKPIVWYDGTFHTTEYLTTETNKKHKKIFENWLTDNR